MTHQICFCNEQALGIFRETPLRRLRFWWGFLLGGMASLVPCGGFVLALGALFFAWLFLWLLYRANIFIKA